MNKKYSIDSSHYWLTFPMATATATTHLPPARQTALALIYPNFNALETTGPAEVFFNIGCSVTVAASDNLTTSQES